MRAKFDIILILQVIKLEVLYIPHNGGQNTKIYMYTTYALKLINNFTD